MNIYNRTQPLLAISAVLAMVLGASEASAANLTAATTQSPTIGKVAAASGSATTNFPLSDSGTLGTPSGGGSKVSGTPKQAIITITCVKNTNCQSKPVTITITATGGSGRGAGTNLSSFTSTASPTSGTVTGTSTLVLPSGIGPKSTTTNSAVAVDVGATFPVLGDTASSATTGSWTFTISASDTFGDSSTPLTVTGTATVEHGLSVTATTLSFGTIASSAGGGAVTYPAGTGTLTVPADTKALGSHSLGSVSVTGEAGQVISMTVTATTMVDQSSTGVSVTLTPSISPGGSQLIPGTAGSAGTKTFAVGGNFTLPAHTVPGTYKGTYSATALYN
ncbi:MAG: DUF4402 domain-containing protein [Phenylobacterium sp.]|nr:MAG: DUF4402 domain-containing protein [Phenylobacterium sp.]